VGLKGVYFAFVAGLTIGYGELVPKAPMARVLAIVIGLTGILFTGLIVALGVMARQAAVQPSRDELAPANRRSGAGDVTAPATHTEPARVANAGFRFDLVAGLTAAAVVLPKATAYATVAGLPVAVGLYTAFIPMVVYALLGTSRVLNVRSTTTPAILAGTQLGLSVPDGAPCRPRSTPWTRADAVQRARGNRALPVHSPQRPRRAGRVAGLADGTRLHAPARERVEEGGTVSGHAITQSTGSNRRRSMRSELNTFERPVTGRAVAAGSRRAWRKRLDRSTASCPRRQVAWPYH